MVDAIPIHKKSISIDRFRGKIIKIYREINGSWDRDTLSLEAAIIQEKFHLAHSSFQRSNEPTQHPRGDSDNNFQSDR